MILENQAKQLVMEQSSTGGGAGASGATFTPGVGEQWAGVALPLVRKIFGQIASKEFVSVQPMNLPAGLVFFLDFQYGTSGKSPFSTAAGTNSLYGNQTTVGDSTFGNAAAGGLYGPGRFGYSINQFSASGVVATSAAVSTTASINFDANYLVLQATPALVTVTVSTASFATFDPNGVRAFEFSGSTGNIISPTSVIQEFTTYNTTAGTISFIVSGSKTNVDTATGSIMVSYNKKTDFNVRGDFEDNGTSATNYAVPNAASNTTIVIPEINVQMRSETISAKARKLKAQWTPEFAQDLNAYHSLDAEAELTGMLSEYISLEIDLEILDMLIQNAQTTDFWSAQVGNQINAGQTAFTSNTAGVYYNQMSWFQTIGIKLQKISNTIHQRTMRGGANFMVVSPAVATILESIPGFAADTDGAADTMNVILMGYRGNQFLECGAVYAPYVPLIMTPLVYDPNTFTPRKGIMTRYAKKMVRPEYYGKLFVADLNVV
jgi:hypothetical protein